jgi:type II secretory pathway component GspD/PulD (secretin)
MIEVNVLEVDLGDDCKHGVDFQQLIQLSGNKIGLNLHGFANPAAPQAFFISVDGHDLNGLLECLKSSNDTKTLASPRGAVLNGQEANIQIGEQLGYRVTTVTETAAIEDVKFLDVGVVLNVTPRISRDGRVVMRVAPKVSAGTVNQDTGLPEEETTQVETDVLLSNGQGMVIGGLIQEKDSSLRQKIPLLGDIWMVGYLFQRNYTEKKRSEIIITLKPVVLPPTQLEDQMREQVEMERASTPLLYGPLCPYPRPWEPRLPRPCDIENRIRLRRPFLNNPCNGYPCDILPDEPAYIEPNPATQNGAE